MGWAWNKKWVWEGCNIYRVIRSYRAQRNDLLFTQLHELMNYCHNNEPPMTSEIEWGVMIHIESSVKSNIHAIFSYMFDLAKDSWIWIMTPHSQTLFLASWEIRCDSSPCCGANIYEQPWARRALPMNRSERTDSLANMCHHTSKNMESKFWKDRKFSSFVQRSPLFCVNIVKNDPGRGRTV